MSRSAPLIMIWLGLFICLGVAVFGYRGWLRGQIATAKMAFPDDPYAIAALAGGAQRVAQAAIISLASSGAFVLAGKEGREIVVAASLPEGAHDVERAIYHEAVQAQPIRVLALVHAAEGLRPIQNIVWTLPPIPSASRPPTRWLIPLQ